MEKRLIVFLVLSFLTITTYPYLMEWMVGPAQRTQTATPSSAPPGGKSQVPSAASPSTSAPQTMAPGDAAAATAAIATPETEKVIETDLYRAVLSSRGGTLKAWTLKKYTQKGPDGVAHALEMLQPDATIRPLTVLAPDGAGQGDAAAYTLDASPLRLDAARPEAKVVMAHTDVAGRRIQKTLRFHHDQYAVEVQIQAQGYAQGYALSLGESFGISDWSQQYGSTAGAVSLVDHKIVRDQPKAETPQVAHGVPGWLALQDKYFIGVLVPKTAAGVATARFHGEKRISADVQVAGGDAAFVLYAGPKAHDHLAALHVQVEEAIDFGWFIAGSWLPVRMVAKPLFYVLNFIYRFCANYGVAIILLTVLVKIAFFPLTKKSMTSMKAMAALQPKMEAIRSKFAKDKTKMNMALMALYKEHGINPVGGCLPVLLQIPVFIALFNVLYVTIELRQAPFIGWITDLSVQDPYYVLPIIMGITMFVQQWTQPNTMDPTQAKIMLFLPVVYTAFSLSFPAGLILYWVVNNTLTVLQQQIISRSA